MTTLLTFFKKSKNHWYRNGTTKVAELEEFLKAEGWVRSKIPGGGAAEHMYIWEPPSPIVNMDGVKLKGVGVDYKFPPKDLPWAFLSYDV